MDHSLSYNHENILFLLARQPLASCSTFSLPIAEICQRGNVSREDVIAAVGKQCDVRDWKITIDLPSDRVLWQHTTRDLLAPIVRVPHTKPAPRIAPAVGQPLSDPVAVGNQARQFQESEFEGRAARSARPPRSRM